MWANMRIFKVGVTRSLRTRQNVDLRNNYAQGGPLCKRGGCVRTLRTPPAYGLGMHVQIL